MKRSNGKALVVGAASGLILALAGMLYIAATGGIPSVTAIADDSGILPVFAPAASALWIAVVLGSATAGFILAVGTRSVARVIQPDARPTPLAIVAAIGMIVAPVVGMAVFPLGVIVMGSIEEGTATISVAELVGLTAAVGIVAGSLVVWLSYVLSRPPAPKQDLGLMQDETDRSAVTVSQS